MQTHRRGQQRAAWGLFVVVQRLAPGRPSVGPDSPGTQQPPALVHTRFSQEHNVGNSGREGAGDGVEARPLASGSHSAMVCSRQSWSSISTSWEFVRDEHSGASPQGLAIRVSTDFQGFLLCSAVDDPPLCWSPLKGHSTVPQSGSWVPNGQLQCCSVGSSLRGVDSPGCAPSQGCLRPSWGI